MLVIALSAGWLPILLFQVAPAVAPASATAFAICVASTWLEDPPPVRLPSAPRTTIGTSAASASTSFVPKSLPPNISAPNRGFSSYPNRRSPTDLRITIDSPDP